MPFSYLLMSPPCTRRFPSFLFVSCVASNTFSQVPFWESYRDRNVSSFLDVNADNRGTREVEPKWEIQDGIKTVTHNCRSFIVGIIQSCFVPEQQTLVDHCSIKCLWFHRKTEHSRHLGKGLQTKPKVWTRVYSGRRCVR